MHETSLHWRCQKPAIRMISAYLGGYASFHMLEGNQSQIMSRKSYRGQASWRLTVCKTNEHIHKTRCSGPAHLGGCFRDVAHESLLSRHVLQHALAMRVHLRARWQAGGC
eukprot:1151392-Pelagomonas_calceolata.AAC.8